MASSTSKGNISTFMLTIALLVILVLVAVLAELMISNGVRTGKYNNPNVATHVVRGTIYDRNGRALALEVPKTSVHVRKDSENIETIAQIISIHSDITPGDIIRAISASDEELVKVASNLDAAEASLLAADLEKGNISADEVALRKDYVRTYPAAFHAAQLISETEKVFDKTLSPAPGFGESTTYGNDVYLTLDLDIQYLLDLALQQVYEIQSPDYAVGLVLDIATGEVLADTTYPFFDLNESSAIPEAQKINRALIGSITRPDVRIAEVKMVLDVTVHNQASQSVEYALEGDFTRNLDVIAEMVRFPDGNTSVVTLLPDENPRYLIFVGSVNPKFYKVSSVLDYVVSMVEQGLAAQNKL